MCVCVCVCVCFDVTDVVAPVAGSPGRRTRPGREPRSSSSPRTCLTPPPPMDPAHRPQTTETAGGMSKHLTSAQEPHDTFQKVPGERKGHPCTRAALSYVGRMYF